MSSTKTTVANGKGKELVVTQVDFRRAMHKTGARKPYAYWRGPTYAAWRLQGAVRAYADAVEQLQFFIPHQDKLFAALQDPTTRETSLFMLDKGGTLLACLRCLEIGDLELLKSQLYTLAYEFFRLAEE